MFYLNLLKESKDEALRRGFEELSKEDLTKLQRKLQQQHLHEKGKQELAEHQRMTKELLNQQDSKRLQEIEKYKKNTTEFNYWFHWVHMDNIMNTVKGHKRFLNHHMYNPIGYYTLNHYLARELYM